MIHFLNRDNFALDAWLELTKPRIMIMVLVTTAIGYYLGGQGIESLKILILTLLGTALTAGGAGTLNHYLERYADARMKRTRSRPIPSGTITPPEALAFGVILTIAGCFVLITRVNLLTAFLALMTTFLYTLVYTPLKRLSWWNTTIGAIPGALPIMGGWTAARDELNIGAWILFGIMFLWQHPHFYAIAWMFRKDYQKAGFKMLPVEDKSGVRTTRQIFGHLLLLLPVSVLPFFLGISGPVYFAGAVIAGMLFLGASIPFYRHHSREKALLILKSSVIYLPVILVLIIVDMQVL